MNGKTKNNRWLNWLLALAFVLVSGTVVAAAQANPPENIVSIVSGEVDDDDVQDAIEQGVDLDELSPRADAGNFFRIVNEGGGQFGDGDNDNGPDFELNLRDVRRALGLGRRGR